MKIGRISLICVSVLLATIASTTSVYAKTWVVVLLDASGSMLTETNGTTRFKDSVSKTEQDLNNLTGDVVVDVYSFTDLGTGLALTEHTNGFLPLVSVGLGVLDVLECVGGIQAPGFDCTTIPASLLNVNHQFPVTPNGGTPLADAMCSSLTTLLGTPAGASDSRILQISSDGLENTSTGTCSGALDAVFDDVNKKWPDGSWQANVISNFFGKGVHADAHLFEFDFRNLPFGPPPDLEAGFSPKTPKTAMFSISAAPAAAATDISPLHQFFLSLAQAVGGRVTVFNDNEPAPLFGDVNGGQCVDITDVKDVARAFGQPAFGSDFDLNVDGKIGFDDYLIATRNITPGCGVASPYTPRDPIVCKGAKRIVIDGQSVADGGITIDVRGSCEITIKNSLIVSGQNAITIVGSAVVIVDDSIIVGENAVITQHGAGVLSAANSIFHGKLDTHGAFQYIDRGGNKFE